jgi:hypothetical protein
MIGPLKLPLVATVSRARCRRLQAHQPARRRAVVSPDELEKDLVGDLLGLLLVAEDQAAQPYQPGRVLAVEGLAMGLPPGSYLTVHEVMLPPCLLGM